MTGATDNRHLQKSRGGGAIAAFPRAALLAALLALSLSIPARAANIEERLDRIINSPCLKRGRVCMVVRSLKTGKNLYEKNPDILMTPASNMKIITAAVALKTLKPWYKFDTIFSYTGTRKGETIEGDLVVSGHGDPHLVSEDLWQIANEVRKRGITRITGSIILDDGYFDGELFPAGWRLSSIRRAFEAPLSALALNFNTATVMIYPDPSGAKPIVVVDPATPYFKVVNRMTYGNGGRKFVAMRMKPRPGGGETMEVLGRIRPGGGELVYYRAVADPVRYFGDTFKSLLTGMGVAVDGGILNAPPSRPTTKLFIHSSRPLLNQVMDMNKYSNNFMAEQILKTVGAEKVSIPGTVAKGLAVSTSVMAEWGITQDRYHFSDGSGLSKDNKISCSALTDVLDHLYHEFDAGPEFISSLAVMGKDGSVRQRDLGTADAVKVKTGTLDAVSAISGYYPLKNGDVLGFSVIFNDLACYNGMAHEIQNHLLMELSSVNGNAAE